MIRKKFILYLVTATAIILLTISYSKVSDDSFNPMEKTVTRETKTEETITDVVLVSGTIEALDSDLLVEKSNLIVCGKITGKSEPFQIQPVSGGGATVYTDYYMKPTKVIDGNLSNSEITIRVEGGTLGNTQWIVNEAPVYEVGEEYLAYLYQPDMGGGYNTAGDYYYTTGMMQGAFNSIDGKKFKSQNKAKDKIITVEEIEIETEKSLADFSLKDECLENAKRNLKNGMISQQEYNETIASLDTYATIVK